MLRVVLIPEFLLPAILLALNYPAASCEESFHPYGKDIIIRSLTPKQASGNALAVVFTAGWEKENGVWEGMKRIMLD